MSEETVNTMDVQAAEPEVQEKNVEAETAVKAEKPKESKAEKFVRLAEPRTDKALKAIANLAGLANTGTYEYTSDQVEYIFTTLEQKLQDVRKMFEAKGGKEKQEAFSFSGMGSSNK